MSRTLLWFRNDLRTVDHPALAAAAAAKSGSQASESGIGNVDAERLGASTLMPLVVFPERLFGDTSFGFAKTGPYRARFLVQSVAALRDELRRLGSDLLVVRGQPHTIIAALAERFAITRLCFQDEPGTEEAEEVGRVMQALCELETRSGQSVQSVPHAAATLYHPDDLPFPPNDIPRVYSNFRRAVEKHTCIRRSLPAPAALPPLPAPMGELEAAADAIAGVQVGLPAATELARVALPPPDPRAAIHPTGGQPAALDRLHTWIWKRDRLRSYKKTRNGLLGEDYSSKLSPWLANGSLSPRTIFAEVIRYEAAREKNNSTYWLVFELIWRDYFAFLARTYPREIFQTSGPKGCRYAWRTDWDAFGRWRSGNTGQPFIDANMREIAASGYMSNRGRQNVASYLARDLRINWLLGAEYFESLLVDYDPASNYGNWTYHAGVGTDPRPNRYFDPARQAQKYDGSGLYRQVWLGDAEP